MLVCLICLVTDKRPTQNTTKSSLRFAIVKVTDVKLNSGKVKKSGISFGFACILTDHLSFNHFLVHKLSKVPFVVLGLFPLLHTHGHACQLNVNITTKINSLLIQILSMWTFLRKLLPSGKPAPITMCWVAVIFL